MNEPTEAQIKEFWEWCGFRWEYVEEVDDGFYNAPDGFTNEHLDNNELLPPIDLNNLFKYAVPKLDYKYQSVRIFSYYDDLNHRMFWFAHVINKDTGDVEYAIVVGCENPALALFWAIWGVIHE